MAPLHHPPPRRRLRRLHRARSRLTPARKRWTSPTDGVVPLNWTERGVVEFDARYVVALDANGDELDGYSRGKG